MALNHAMKCYHRLSEKGWSLAGIWKMHTPDCTLQIIMHRMVTTRKSKVVPDSITSVGDRADPSFLAVSPHVRPSGRLPLLSTRPAVTTCGNPQSTQYRTKDSAITQSGSSQHNTSNHLDTTLYYKLAFDAMCSWSELLSVCIYHTSVTSLTHKLLVFNKCWTSCKHMCFNLHYFSCATLCLYHILH